MRGVLKSPLARVALVASVSIVAACTTAPSLAPVPVSRGTLFIVGGGPQPTALVKEFVDLAGGAGRARIVVFAMASVTGATSGDEKAKDLRALGATSFNVWVDRKQADTDSIARLLDGATGVWFGGGDRMPSDSGDVNLTIARENMVVDTGFALLTNAIVDQHFLRRKRHNRLISLVLERPEHLGIGIDESTALIVEPDGRWRIAGASAAVIYDARRAAITAPGGVLGATGMAMHVLPAGGRFDPGAGTVSLPPR